MSSYYLLNPCRTTAAYVATLKKPRRLNLTEARRKLEAAGYAVTDVKVMLIVDTRPELTLYESGKILIKTDDPDDARRAIDDVYAILGLHRVGVAA
jgi:TATA-box binding protein (TBP) (component of TFIID and TFIIIB)